MKGNSMKTKHLLVALSFLYITNAQALLIENDSNDFVSISTTAFISGIEIKDIIATMAPKGEAEVNIVPILKKNRDFVSSLKQNHYGIHMKFFVHFGSRHAAKLSCEIYHDKLSVCNERYLYFQRFSDEQLDKDYTLRIFPSKKAEYRNNLIATSKENIVGTL